MNVSLYQAASALNANNRWQEIIAENLTSSSIPGFRHQEVTMEAVEAGLLQSPGAALGGQPQRFLLPRAAVSTNFGVGEMQRTDNGTDAAIEGPGFFAVQMPDGSTGYTRVGQFRVDATGQLVSRQGHPVLGENGPILLDPRNHEPVTISPKGEVNQGTELKGQLKLVEFDQPELLTSVGGVLFLAQNPAAVENPAANSTVWSGWIERSNTSPMLEMANMITAMRAYESSQRVIQLQDERMGRTISELGTP